MRRIVSCAAEMISALAILAVIGWAAHTIWVPVRVAGMSMRPALTAGDLVVVRADASAVPGRIVLVREAGHAAMLHRVVAVNPDGSVRTRGDANPVEDITAAPPSAVRGVVVAVVPVGSWAQRWRHRAAVR